MGNTDTLHPNSFLFPSLYNFLLLVYNCNSYAAVLHLPGNHFYFQGIIRMKNISLSVCLQNRAKDKEF